MSQPKVTGKAVRARPAKESLEGIIHRIFSQLACYFENAVTGGRFEIYLNDRFDAMERDRTIDPKSLVTNFLQRTRTMNDEGEISRQRIIVATDISLYFCLHADKAYTAGKHEKAWYFATEATKWQGIACGSEHAFFVRRNIARNLAAAGGRGRADLYEPLRQFASKAAKEKNYKSRRSAALSIKPEVLKLAKELGIPLSEQQAEKTITGWLQDIPFASTRIRELANMLR